MMFRRLCLLVSLFYFASDAHGQFSKDPFTDYVIRRSAGIPSIGDQLASAAVKAGQLAAMKAELSRNVAAARRAFWQAYPNGPDFDRARQEFDLQLRDKDQYYVMTSLPAMNFPAFGSLTGGEVDGGIPPGAKQAFDRWANQVRANIGNGELNAKTLGLLLDPSKAKAEIAKADPAYQNYEVRRDLEEFRVKGVAPANVDPELWSTIQLAFTLRAEAGMTDPERNVDPYTYAFSAWEKRGLFSTGCSNMVARLTPQAPSGACSCIYQAFSGSLAAREFARVRFEFSEEKFLLTSVSKIGLHERIAACLRH